MRSTHGGLTMPLYDFICNLCGEKFETLVLRNEHPFCPRCGGYDLAKQMSTFAFRSRGGGESMASSGSGSKCSGCASKSCSTCH